MKGKLGKMNAHNGLRTAMVDRIEAQVYLTEWPRVANVLGGPASESESWRLIPLEALVTTEGLIIRRTKEDNAGVHFALKTKRHENERQVLHLCFTSGQLPGIARLAPFRLAETEVELLPDNKSILFRLIPEADRKPPKKIHRRTKKEIAADKAKAGSAQPVAHEDDKVVDLPRPAPVAPAATLLIDMGDGSSYTVSGPKIAERIELVELMRQRGHIVEAHYGAKEETQRQ